MTDRQRGRQKDRQTVNRHKRTRKRNVGKKDSFPAERSRMEKRRMNIRKRPPPEKKKKYNRRKSTTTKLESNSFFLTSSVVNA